MPESSMRHEPSFLKDILSACRKIEAIVKGAQNNFGMARHTFAIRSGWEGRWADSRFRCGGWRAERLSI